MKGKVGRNLESAMAGESVDDRLTATTHHYLISVQTPRSATLPARHDRMMTRARGIGKRKRNTLRVKGRLQVLVFRACQTFARFYVRCEGQPE